MQFKLQTWIKGVRFLSGPILSKSSLENVPQSKQMLGKSWWAQIDTLK